VNVIFIKHYNSALTAVLYIL